MNRTFSFSKHLEIEGRFIGPGHPVFIIAEIGVNHNGDMDIARRTVKAAAKAGADCVKFQSFQTEEFMADRDLVYEYENGGQKIRESMYDMFKRLEFPLDRHHEIFKFARSCGIAPLTSVADPVCMAAALGAGAGALKLASEDLINHPLLREVAKAGLPLILSTGMADEVEIQDALDILMLNQCSNVAFLHCVSLYPTHDEDANIERIKKIKRLTGSIVGYSDHTEGSEACVAAVALGAKIIEKHFTIDRSLPGPDHSLSADSAELKGIVMSVRRIEKMLGTGNIAPSKNEVRSKLSFRRSVVAARDLAAGTALSADDLILKRPGDGLHPRQLSDLYGRRLNATISKDQQMKHEILSNR
jgi:N,N'-diacetyllegionaminate synthase